MFSVIDGVLLKPLDYRQPERLISLHIRITTLKNLGVMPLPPFIYDLWRAHATMLESIAVVRPGSDNLTAPGEPERILSARVSPSLFPTLGVWPALGRAYSGPDAALLSDGFWRRRFGADPGILGRKIQLNGEPYSVIGVMPRGFELPIDLQSGHASRCDVLLPADIPPEQRLSHGYWGVARLKPGVSLEQARAELDANLASLNDGLERQAIAEPLRDNLTGRVQRGLGILMAAVALVLLIACGNLANLLLSRGMARRQEIAVRVALGARRGQIVRQLLAESLGLAMLGAAAGALCARWTLHAVLAGLPMELPHRAAIGVDARALVFCLALTVVCTLLFAGVPAWRCSAADPQEALRQSQRGSTGARGSQILRRWLIASQVALCTMLLIGSGLLVRSLANVLNADRGFETAHVLTAEVPLEGERYADSGRRNAAYRSIEARLAAIPGVTAAGAVSWLPLSGDEYVNPIFLPRTALTPEVIRNLPMAQIRFATPGYFSAAGVPLLAGHTFTESAADLWAAVVSAGTARRVWPGRDAIGQQFTIDESPNPRIWRVAGIAADVRQSELQSAAPMMVYLPAAHNRGMDLSFVLRTSLPTDAVARVIRRAVAEVDAGVPVGAIREMREIVAASTAERRFQALLLAGFASVALLLAALGIYGTLSYAVGRRSREIGIRLALGAQRRDVGSLLLLESLTPVLLGALVGCAGALVLMRALSSMLFGVGIGDAPTYLAAGALMFVVALVSCWPPASRAMRLDPAETMRCE
jgi:predicted permease